MRTGRESNQGIVFPASRYKKTPYDMRDLERVIVEMPKEIIIKKEVILRDEKRDLGDKIRMFEEYNDRRISMMGWSMHKTLLYLGIGGGQPFFFNSLAYQI